MGEHSQQDGISRHMSKKKKIIISGLIIILLAGMAAVIVYFFNLNRFKPAIIRTVKHYTGRELTIDGDLRLLAHWPPTLMAEDIAFQNAPWGSKPHMLRIKRAALAVSIKPLLRGEFRFFHIRLQEPEVLLEFNQAGVSNFLLDIPESQGPNTLPVLAFNDIIIQNGYFEYRDERSAHNIAVNVDDLKADIAGLDKPTQILFDGRFKGIPCSLDGSIGPIVAWIQPGYTLQVDLNAGLGKAKARLVGEIRDPIELKDISLHFSAHGPSNREITDLMKGKPVPDLGSFSIDAELTDQPGQLAIDKLALHLGSPDQVAFSVTGMIEDLIGLKGFSLDLGVQTAHTNRLMLLADLPPPPFKAPLSAFATFSDAAEKRYRLDNLLINVGDEAIQGSLDLDLTRVKPLLDLQLQSKHTTLGPLVLNTQIRTSADRISVEHFDFQMGHDDLIKAFANGTADNVNPLENLHLNFNILGKNLAHLQKLTRQPLPVHGPYAMSGALFMADQQSAQVSDLKIILDKSSITGSLGLEMAHEHPLLLGHLTASRLNLERLLTPKSLPDKLGENLSSIGPSRLTFEVAGPIEHPVLNRVELQTQVQDLASLTLTGSIGNMLTMAETDLNFSVTGTELAHLEKVMGQGIPFKGPYSLSFHLRNTANRTYHLETVKVTTEKNTFHGRSIIEISDSTTTASVYLETDNISLEALAEGQNDVLDRLRVKKDLGPFKVEATAVVSDTGQQLQALDLTFGKDDFIHLRVKGSIGNLENLQDMQLYFQASGQRISNLEPVAGRKIPLQGAYELSGEISGQAPHNIMLRNLGGMLANNRFVGWANLNLAGQYPVVESKISADHFSAALITLEAVDPLKNIPDLGPLKLAFTLSEKDGVPSHITSGLPPGQGKYHRRHAAGNHWKPGPSKRSDPRF